MINKRPEAAEKSNNGDNFDYMVLINELRDELRLDIDNLADKINGYEEKHEEILGNMGSNSARIDLLSKNITAIEEFQARTSSESNAQVVQPTQDLGISKELLEELESKIDSKLQELDHHIETKVDGEKFSSELDTLKSQIADLQSQEYVTPSQFKSHSEDIEDLREALHKFNSVKDQIQSFIGKLNSIESSTKSYEDSIEHLEKEMHKKASNENIQILFNRAKTSEKDIDRLDKQTEELHKQIELINKRTPNFEKWMAALEVKLENVNDACNKRINDNERTCDYIQSSLDATKEQTEKVDVNLIKLTQVVNSMKAKMDLLDEAFNGFMVPNNLLGGGTDSNNVELLKDSISSIRREFFKYKDECSANFTVIGETLSKNADKHDLKELENKLMEKIEKNEKIMLKNKSELRRLFKDTDDKLNKLKDGSASRGPSMNRDDAMLARKHEGWKCTNCEKDLVNMAGLPVEFFNWKKMPKRDKERVPMMGQGFSRMLQTVSPDMTLSVKNSATKSKKVILRDEPSTLAHSMRRNSGSIPSMDIHNSSVDDSRLPDISMTK